MVHDGCNYFSFWAIFCTFNPLTARKIKNFFLAFIEELEKQIIIKKAVEVGQ